MSDALSSQEDDLRRAEARLDASLANLADVRNAVAVARRELDDATCEMHSARDHFDDLRAELLRVEVGARPQ